MYFWFNLDIFRGHFFRDSVFLYCFCTSAQEWTFLGSPSGWHGTDIRTDNRSDRQSENIMPPLQVMLRINCSVGIKISALLELSCPPCNFMFVFIRWGFWSWQLTSTAHRCVRLTVYILTKSEVRIRLVYPLVPHAKELRGYKVKDQGH